MILSVYKQIPPQSEKNNILHVHIPLKILHVNFHTFSFLEDKV